MLYASLEESVNPDLAQGADGGEGWFAKLLGKLGLGKKG